MPSGPVNPTLRSVLEIGPIVGFLLAYLWFRNDTFRVGDTDYTGFVAVTAAFVPVFLVSIALLWRLTGRLTRLQVVTTTMLVLFGGMSVWFNDPDLFKMKPTAIYLLLALILGVGLLRGQSWLKFVLEDMIPLRDKGWMILTRRMTVLFVLSALANEVVWRTQSEAFWVFFETLAMPVIVFAFFLGQIGLFIDHVTLKSPGKKPGRDQVRRGRRPG